MPHVTLPLAPPRGPHRAAGTRQPQSHTQALIAMSITEFTRDIVCAFICIVLIQIYKDDSEFYCIYVTFLVKYLRLNKYF